MSNLYFIKGNYPITPTAASVKLLDHCIAEEYIPVGHVAVYTTYITNNRTGAMAIELSDNTWNICHFNGQHYALIQSRQYDSVGVFANGRFSVEHFSPDTTPALRVMEKDPDYIEALVESLHRRGFSNGQLDLIAVSVYGLTQCVDLQAQKVFIFKDTELMECIDFSTVPAKIHIRGDVFKLEYSNKRIEDDHKEPDVTTATKPNDAIYINVGADYPYTGMQITPETDLWSSLCKVRKLCQIPVKPYDDDFEAVALMQAKQINYLCPEYTRFITLYSKQQRICLTYDSNQGWLYLQSTVFDVGVRAKKLDKEILMGVEAIVSINLEHTGSTDIPDMFNAITPATQQESAQFDEGVKILVETRGDTKAEVAHWTPSIGMFVTVEGREGVYVIEDLFGEVNEFIVRTTIGTPRSIAVPVNTVKPFRLEA